MTMRRSTRVPSTVLAHGAAGRLALTLGTAALALASLGADTAPRSDPPAGRGARRGAVGVERSPAGRRIGPGRAAYCAHRSRYGRRDLSVPGRVTQSGGLHHDGAVHVPVPLDHVSGRQPDPNVEALLGLGPAVGLDGLLDGHRRGGRVGGRVQDRQAPVPGARDHPPPGGLHRLAQQPVMDSLELVGRILTEPLSQAPAVLSPRCHALDRNVGPA